MTKRITSVSGLPDWFKNRTYKKRLSKVDWFREIRMRQTLNNLMKMQQSDEDSLLNISSETRRILLNMLTTTPSPDSPIFFVSQSARPIHDLTAGEALYLRSAVRDGDLVHLGMKYDTLLSLWLKVRNEAPEGPTPLFREYEQQAVILK